MPPKRQFKKKTPAAKRKGTPAKQTQQRVQKKKRTEPKTPIDRVRSEARKVAAKEVVSRIVKAKPVNPVDAHGPEDEPDVSHYHCGTRMASIEEITSIGWVHITRGDESGEWSQKTTEGHWVWKCERVSDTRHHKFWNLFSCPECGKVVSNRRTHGRGATLFNHACLVESDDDDDDDCGKPLGKEVSAKDIALFKSRFALLSTMAGIKDIQVHKLAKGLNRTYHLSIPTRKEMSKWRQNRYKDGWVFLKKVVADAKFIGLSLDGGVLDGIGCHVIVGVIYVKEKSYCLPPLVEPDGKTLTSTDYCNYIVDTLGPKEDGFNCLEKITWLLVDGASTNLCTLHVVDAVARVLDETPDLTVLQEKCWLYEIGTMLNASELKRVKGVRCSPHKDKNSFDRAFLASGAKRSAMYKFLKWIDLCLREAPTRRKRWAKVMKLAQKDKVDNLENAEKILVNLAAVGDKARTRILAHRDTKACFKALPAGLSARAQHLDSTHEMFEKMVTSLRDDVKKVRNATPKLAPKLLGATRYATTLYGAARSVYDNYDAIVGAIKKSITPGREKNMKTFKALRKLVEESEEKIRRELASYLEIAQIVVTKVQAQCDVTRREPTIHEAASLQDDVLRSLQALKQERVVDNQWKHVAKDWNIDDDYSSGDEGIVDEQRLLNLPKTSPAKKSSPTKKSSPAKKSSPTKKSSPAKKTPSKKQGGSTPGKSDFADDEEEEEDEDDAEDEEQDEDEKSDKKEKDRRTEEANLRGPSIDFPALELTDSLIREFSNMRTIWGDPTKMHEAARFLWGYWVYEASVGDDGSVQDFTDDALKEAFQAFFQYDGVQNLPLEYEGFREYIGEVMTWPPTSDYLDENLSPTKYWDDVLASHTRSPAMKAMAELALSVLWLPTAVTQCDSVFSFAGNYFGSRMWPTKCNTAAMWIFLCANGDFDHALFGGTKIRVRTFLGEHFEAADDETVV